METVETFMQGKLSEELCEDTYMVNEDYAVVIDGATDKSGLLFDGVKGGKMVAQIVKEVFEKLEAGVSVYEAIKTINTEVHKKTGELKRHQKPAAVFAAYSRARGEIWMVGDCQAATLGQEWRTYTNESRLDEITSAARAVYLQANELRGELDVSKGRDIIMPLLEVQNIYINQDPRKVAFAYGAINGDPVPEDLIKVVKVPLGTGELVLCSDGYPYICKTLAEAEEKLAKLLTEDPGMYKLKWGTKAVQGASFDDRTYVRIKI